MRRVFLFEAQSLKKRYKKQDAYVLDNVSFALPSTGLVAIQGKSGSGKSTLLHILLGLTKPSGGKVLYKGKNLSSFSQKDWIRFRRYETAMVFQHYRLISHLSAIDNIALSMQIAGISRHKARKRAMELLKAFGLERCAKKKAKVLSGGESQRVAICRSFANEPSVIFADEPTGALDSKNAKLVMGMLREYSKHALVLLVSHNEELVKEYADDILYVEDGKISHQRRPIEPAQFEIDRHPLKNGNWSTSFLLDHFRQHPGSVGLRYISSFIGFVSILLCVGFAFGSEPALEERKADTLEYLTFSISNKEYIEIPASPLRLVKETRPSYEETMWFFEGIEHISFHNDYSYFFPASLPFVYEGKRQEPCKFLPIYDISLLEYGSSLVVDESNEEAPNAYSCIVNEEFMNQYGCEIGGTIHAEYETEIVAYDTKEHVISAFDFQIRKVVREFTFLNSPKVYYSYPEIDRFYGDYLLDNLPLRNGRKQSVASFVTSSRGDESYASFAHLVYAHTLEDANEVMKLLEAQSDEGIMIQSNAYDVAVSFISLSSALVTASILFMGIAVISLVLIIALNAYSSFLCHKQESAVLMVLGARRGDIISLVSLEGLVISQLAGFFALGFAFFLQKSISLLLEEEFGVPDLIRIPYETFQGIPFLFIALVLLVGALVSFLSSALPLLVAGKIDLSEALKEE